MTPPVQRPSPTALALVVVDDMPKRTFDLTLATLGLLMLLPLLAIIAIAIKWDTPGPVFYRGRRSGRGGIEFAMLKFRTMFVDATSPRKGFTTGLNDARVTRVGRVLRRFKLDEFPQLINVVRGEMSLVGPRPEVPYYTQQYSGDELLILSVRPGITDHSSIHFYNLHEVVGAADADDAFERWVLPTKNKLRVKYVKERSFFGDLRLIFKTFWVLGRRVLPAGK